MKRLSKAVVCTVAGLMTISGGLAQRPSEEHVPSRLLVQTAPGVEDSAAGQAMALAGAKVHHKIDSLGVSVLEVPEQALDAVTQALQRSGRFTFVERDFVAHGMATPNDPDFVQQWHLSKIQAPNAWTITTGSASVPIAILDSGADGTHPDLSPKLLPGWNFVTGTASTADNGALGGHGTAVSGAAAAATNNLTGVAGVGWANMILPLVILDANNYATYSNIASAITYAADHGARIISISIAGPTASSTLQSAVDYAWNKGSVIFAAAGNSSSSAPNYPAACNNVLAISATEPTDTLSSFSNYGTWIDLSAPGDTIITTQKGGGYWSCYGTSLATPIAAAVGALALSANPSLSASALVTLLRQNSDDLGAVGYDPYFGWGRVNAYKTVLAAKNLLTTADTASPTVSITAPFSGATLIGTVAVQGTAADNVGVTKIELDVDGAAVATTTSSPFSFSWNSTAASNGTHSISVKAYDAANNVGSAVVTVTVSNALPDTTPPTVSLSAPTSGATVMGTVSVQGTASDSAGVTKIQLYVDGAAVATATSSPFSFSWNSTAQANGSHTLTIKAYDPANNVGTASAGVVVNNPIPPATLDTTPPVVVITQPGNGSSVSRNFNIAVSATDNVGVSHVSIYVDNVQLCNDTLAPYTCAWNTRKASSGSHTITATGWDAAGNAGKAVAVTVTK